MPTKSVKKRPQPRKKEANDPGRLIKILQQLPEETLTQTVISPLLKQMYEDSSVEYTHGPLEAGRDLIVSTAHRSLKESYIICIQVKNEKLSIGATTGPYSVHSVKNQIQAAKDTGVTTISGNTIWPNEIWLITSYPFPDPRRRQVREILSDISKMNGHVVDGNQTIQRGLKLQPFPIAVKICQQTLGCNGSSNPTKNGIRLAPY